MAFKNDLMRMLFVCLLQGLPGEVGPFGASGPRVGSDLHPHCFSHPPITALHLFFYLCPLTGRARPTWRERRKWAHRSARTQR